MYPAIGMHLTTLNQDVLSMIVSYLSTWDALRLSETCRGILCIARNQALSSVTLGVNRPFNPTGTDNPHEGQLFCLYVLADVPGRLHRVRRLGVHTSIWRYFGSPAPQRGYVLMSEYSLAPLLASVLENAANLQHLLLGDAAGLMCNEPRIAAALSVLPSLTTLRLNDLASTDYDHIFHAVSNMCSPNLRTLEIQHMLDQSFSGSPFLSVHRVVLDECSVHTPIGIYSLFPNVRDLILLHTDFEAAEEGNWSDLNYFHGSTHNWICLQMRCSVARLELENTLSLYNVSRRPFDCSTPAEVLQVLQYASPKSLYLCIDTNFDLGEQFWKRFVTSLPRLQCLELALDYVALGLETPESEWLGDFMPWTVNMFFLFWGHCKSSTSTSPSLYTGRTTKHHAIPFTALQASEASFLAYLPNT
ncbi:hypothetical protein POSPLADRAFT_1058789 [Postia placenta MAD-698-R-SB12]|uniref:F-box domain-containing protein n=1 Tax=Postia placenta MAD-698-R-SB12 TaxID=670580 RepID=A0A1X6MW74_9APHY|nr:hypothetical protein POSPLADRAFT_1058789 [Postia placenta MAD-698-R-SB12]OSX60624.1 hypothetical protein POSPLADRAFT_1058789 [Postia placenta MAD-698-R-SB12]